jgi:hypothetical protein
MSTTNRIAAINFIVATLLFAGRNNQAVGALKKLFRNDRSVNLLKFQTRTCSARCKALDAQGI